MSGEHRVPRLDERSAGLLVPLWALPGGHGIGDLGPASRRFLELLARSGQRWWQLLPIGPPRRGHSPYSAFSAFAGNPDYLSLEDLRRDGWLRRSELPDADDLNGTRVAHARVRRVKQRCLRRAFAAFRRKPTPRLLELATKQAHWLEDWTLFRALSSKLRCSWRRWPNELRERQRRALASARRELSEELEYQRFLQLLFEDQWLALRAHAARLGIGLIGDLPLHVDLESADVWAHPRLFQLTAERAARFQTGVPPDAFSNDGQLWGHPHYEWPVHARDGFAWWRTRLAHELRRHDALRLDHFIGFVREWRVDGAARTARHGRWVSGPGSSLLEAVLPQLDDPQLIAEDLGSLTAEVTALRERFELPNLRVLQFSLGDDPSQHPERWPRRAVAMTGTHDNDTLAGWWRSLPEAERRRARRLALGGPARMHERLIRVVYESAASVALLPLQDVLALGSEARLNRPGTARGNWSFRFSARAVSRRVEERLRGWTESSGRSG